VVISASKAHLGAWNDKGCASRYGFVCEYPPSTPAPTVAPTTAPPTPVPTAAATGEYWGTTEFTADAFTLSADARATSASAVLLTKKREGSQGEAVLRPRYTRWVDFDEARVEFGFDFKIGNSSVGGGDDTGLALHLGSGSGCLLRDSDDQVDCDGLSVVFSDNDVKAYRDNVTEATVKDAYDDEVWHSMGLIVSPSDTSGYFTFEIEIDGNSLISVEFHSGDLHSDGEDSSSNQKITFYASNCDTSTECSKKHLFKSAYLSVTKASAAPTGAPTTAAVEAPTPRPTTAAPAAPTAAPATTLAPTHSSGGSGGGGRGSLPTAQNADGSYTYHINSHHLKLADSAYSVHYHERDAVVLTDAEAGQFGAAHIPQSLAAYIGFLDYATNVTFTLQLLPATGPGACGGYGFAYLYGANLNCVLDSGDGAAGNDCNGLSLALVTDPSDAGAYVLHGNDQLLGYSLGDAAFAARTTEVLATYSEEDVNGDVHVRYYLDGADLFGEEFQYAITENDRDNFKLIFEAATGDQCAQKTVLSGLTVTTHKELTPMQETLLRQYLMLETREDMLNFAATLGALEANELFSFVDRAQLAELVELTQLAAGLGGEGEGGEEAPGRFTPTAAAAAGFVAGAAALVAALVVSRRRRKARSEFLYSPL